MPGLVETRLELSPRRDDPEVSAPVPDRDTPSGEDPLLTGYQDCAAEAVRYLVEEEGRAPDDPTVVGLTEHLQARSAYLEYLSLLRRLETDMEDQLGKLLRSGPDQPPQRRQQHQQHQQRQDGQPLLSDQQRLLVESVFRGCDLVLQRQESVPPSPPPSPPAEQTRRVHFNNNAYLDQVLSWAYTPSSEH